MRNENTHDDRKQVQLITFILICFSNYYLENHVGDSVSFGISPQSFLKASECWGSWEFHLFERKRNYFSHYLQWWCGFDPVVQFTSVPVGIMMFPTVVHWLFMILVYCLDWTTDWLLFMCINESLRCFRYLLIILFTQINFSFTVIRVTLWWLLPLLIVEQWIPILRYYRKLRWLE